MLRKVKSALLLSDVKSFSEHYRSVSADVDVELKCESNWNRMYRVNADVVILGSKYLGKLNPMYYSIATVILKEGESPAPYIKEGITRFVFNYRNDYELLCALYKVEATVIHAFNAGVDEVLKGVNTWNFQCGDYDFKFDLDRYTYKGKQIFINATARKYLAEWLLTGHKDNSRRMILCNLRKSLGSGFLRDIDRYGRLKGGKDEQ